MTQHEPRPKAISYLRFSTPDQIKGDSLRRQAQLAEEYAVRRGLELDTSLTFRDLGLSAFRGANAETGKLAEFLQAVRMGLVERGSYLLVESLDRISRQAARKALRVLEDICDEDIVVVTLSDGREYTAESLTNDPTSLIMSILTFMRAHEESAIKSQRVRAAWKNKRANAGDKPLTSRCPAWLELDKETGTFRVIEERAAIVRRIFADTLMGCGQNAIAEALNLEGVAAWGDAGRRGKYWHRSYVLKIVQSQTVLGIFTPHETEYLNGKKIRKPLDPIPGYYPAVIDEETFHRVQSMRMGSRSPLRGAHAGGAVRNMFGGLLKCSACGATSTLLNKGQGRGDGRYVVCRAAKAGAGCVYRAVRYQLVEDAFLAYWSNVFATAPSAAGDDQSAEIDQLDAEILGTADAIERILDSIQRGGATSALNARLRKLETAADDLRRQRDALMEQRAALVGPLAERKLDDLADALTAEQLDRTVVNALLRQIFASVEIDAEGGQLTFRWKTGGESSLTFAVVEQKTTPKKAAKKNAA